MLIVNSEIIHIMTDAPDHEFFQGMLNQLSDSTSTKDRYEVYAKCLRYCSKFPDFLREDTVTTNALRDTALHLLASVENDPVDPSWSENLITAANIFLDGTSYLSEFDVEGGIPIDD